MLEVENTGWKKKGAEITHRLVCIKHVVNNGDFNDLFRKTGELSPDFSHQRCIMQIDLKDNFMKNLRGSFCRGFGCSRNQK